MLYIENLDANSFSMYGDNSEVVPETYPKNYEAKSILVTLDQEPRISITHARLGTRIVFMKECTDIEIDSATFTTAEDVVAAFNLMMKTTP